MSKTGRVRGPGKQQKNPDESIQRILHELGNIHTDIRQLLALFSPAADTAASVSAPPTESPAPEAHQPQSVSLPRPHPRPTGQYTLWVRCLGECLVLLNGQPLNLGRSQKGQTLFRFLAVNGGGPIPREVLMELLWPGVSSEQARHRLNMAVYSLRQATRHPDGPADGLLLLTEGAYMLNPQVRLALDADEFLAAFHAGEAALAAGDETRAAGEYQRACALYTGAYLPEERYADWTRLTRQRLEDARNTCLVKLSRIHLAHRDFEQAIECALRVLAEDLCREEVHRILMRCYALTGRREQALRQFEFCCQVLQQELGLGPAEKTRRLVDEIREGLPV